MSKTYYVLANFFEDETNNHPWMTSIPFYQTEGEGTHLCMLRDTNINFVANSGDILKFSLYKINVDNMMEYHKKRHYLFESKNFSFNNVRSFGFEKIVDFNYKVDVNYKTQEFCGIKINFSYDNDTRMFGDKYYLCLPSVDF